MGKFPEVSRWTHRRQYGLPYALLVRDRDGKNLVAYWDIEKQAVKWTTGNQTFD